MASFDDMIMGVGSGGSGSAMQNFAATEEELNSTAKDSLIFPTDMTKKFYPEAIKFSIYERSGVSYDGVKELFKSAYQTGGAYLEADSERVLAKDQIEKLSEEINSLDLSTNEGLARLEAIGAEANVADAKRLAAVQAIESHKIIGKAIAKTTQAEFTKAREEQSLKKTQDRLIQSIYLAMPESVNFAEGVEWQGTDLGVVGGLKSGALNMDNALDYGVLTGAGAALGGAAGLGASMIPGISGIAGTVLGAVLGNNTIQTGIESTFGVKTNPFKEQTFQGVGFRPFDFSFNFRARSQSDVIVIQDIIRAFRSYSKPTFKEGSNGSIFKYPKEFRIEFLTIDDNNSYVTNDYLPEIKFCICTAINTNFTAQGWKSFEGGAPTDITLQMTFQETEIVTGEDVDGDTEIGRFADYGGNF